jgi:hypothetical protein
VVGSVELANDAVVADVTVSAHGACALVLIDGNDEDELELDGTLRVGPAVGVGIVEVLGDADVDPLKGDGVGAATVLGGAVWAPAFAVAIRRTIPVTAPLRSHLSGKANVNGLGVIAGDP